MTTHFPFEFTLDNGTPVVVNKTGTNTYDFTLHPEDGATRQFTYVNDGRTKTEAEASLGFEEIDALRRFWLANEDIL